MKKKILIVIANYYKNISNDLLNSAKKNLNKKSSFKYKFYQSTWCI